MGSSVRPAEPVHRVAQSACALAVFATLAWLASSCDGLLDSPPQPSVVIVLVDQLRKDAFDRWMPATNALAERGVVLDGMRAAAPWTYPSVISLMSGLYPQQHGANGEMEGTRLSTFASNLPVLPKLMRASGYATAGFVSNAFLHDFNPFHEGFDTYQVFVGSQGNLRGAAELVWKREMFADTLIPSVMEHYAGRPLERPEFTYVHLIDVHGPWDEAPFAPDYEAAVRYVDERVAELHAFFAQRYANDLLFVVTSDHGRELGDELALEPPPLRARKKSMHDFNLHIPFAILPGANVPAGIRSDVVCSNVDVLPTLLDWLGRRPPAVLAGVSLLPVIHGNASAVVLAPRAIYARNDAWGYRSDCAVIEDKKYVRWFDPQSGRITARRVYDLAADPAEVGPLHGPFGETEEVLSELAGIGAGRYDAYFEPTDAATLEELRSLGYLGGGGDE